MKKALIIVLCAVLCCSLSACGEATFEWSDIVLGTMLPEPPTNKGDVHSNTAQDLWLDVSGITGQQAVDYIEACKATGFTVDMAEDTTSFDAYNADGYKLEIRYYSSLEKLTIDVEPPMEMGDIVWPTSDAGNQLPKPTSAVGKFSFENEDSFFVYIGSTTREEYADYVAACVDKGFVVDYRKGDDYYFADNSEGWSVAVRYEGNNIMSIDIDAPTEEATATTTTATGTSKTNLDSDIGLDPTFKAAMDSYESFMDEYVVFMEKYQADPTNLSLLGDYAVYMSKYADFVDAFEEWENEDLNDVEMAYYIDVQARVSKKLLEVAS